MDIETTGGSATRSRITEIACYQFDGDQVVDSYQRLINPECEIPYSITKLTGIDNAMVSNSPTFSELADEIEAFTKDHIFIAHNVNFDYKFIQAEFARLGMEFRRKKLCTVRLSRKLLPGKISYSLGRLCDNLGISLKNRHRAAGDAEATVVLFQKLLEVDTDDFIQKSLKPQSLEGLIPPHISSGEFLALPEKAGIYYFLDQKKKIVYIGKAKNIKKRIHSHFSGNSNTGSKDYFLNTIHGIDFKLIPHELLMNLMEATEIKKHWPRYNRSMKRVTLNHGLFSYEDRKGYLRFNMGRCGKHDKPLITFKSQIKLKHFLLELVENYGLCPRLSGLQPLGSGRCNYIEEYHCKGACVQEESVEEYNERVNQAIHEKINPNNTYLIHETIANSSESALILVEKGRYKGFGSVSKETEVTSLSQAKELVQSAYDDQDMAMLIHAYLSKKPETKRIFF